MARESEYDHFHEKSSEWFRENFINYSAGSDKERDVHRHKIVERASGKVGEGFGWSYNEAKEKAWEDLRRKGIELAEAAQLEL